MLELTSKGTDNDPGNTRTKCQDTWDWDQEEDESGEEDVNVRIVRGGGQGGLGIVLCVDMGLSGSPGSAAVLLLYAVVQEEAAEEVERRLGEIFLMRGVLLNTSYQHQVWLFPQLMESQGIGYSRSIAVVGNINIVELQRW